MNRKMFAAIAVLLSLASSACTSDGLKRTAYEAAYQKGCMERTAMPDCDPGHQTYDQYERARSAL